MFTVCPKCGYKRTLHEAAPDWQCPSCSIAYEKYVALNAMGAKPVSRSYVVRQNENANSFTSKVVKRVLACALIGAVLSFVWNSESVREKFKKNLLDAGTAVVEASVSGDYSKARIVMYSLTTCGYCVSLRQRFQTHNIPFTEHFVDTDPARRDELFAKLRAAGFTGGGIGTPTLEVNGKLMPNNPPFQAILTQARS